MDTPINVFSDWAQNGKDEGMEKHHNKSVMSMIDFACNGLPEYSFIDAGCGNGWVVRHISKDDRCCRAIGVDGSLNMIKKQRDLIIKINIIVKIYLIGFLQKKLI